eukprot:GHRQ01032270.1.p1 GENE.GHRQ01032270.1~~GHRQ01032270.1.p1  ORF type:complete len:121 (-),score=17.43 GHRQ01032270.1:81-443(-)
MTAFYWLFAAALISFSYFLSTLFTASRVAGTATQLLYALSMIPGCVRVLAAGKQRAHRRAAHHNPACGVEYDCMCMCSSVLLCQPRTQAGWPTTLGAHVCVSIGCAGTLPWHCWFSMYGE